MKTEIENLIAIWHDEIPTIFIRLLNAATLSQNKEQFANALSVIARETRLDDFFEYGFGKTHFWLHQRKLSNGKAMPYRILIVRL